MALEGLVSSAHTFPLRVYARALCLMLHDVKRWADIQHCVELVYRTDAIVATSYKSKKKRKPLKWACLRAGFGKSNWGSEFCAACVEASAPGPDFLLRRPTTDLKSFTDEPAEWKDGNRVMHALLMMVGMKAEAAAVYVLHSCRHISSICWPIAYAL